MKIIRQPSREECVRRFLDFRRVLPNGKLGSSGYSFDCDEEGNPLWEDLPAAALENLGKCLCGEEPVRFLGVQVSRWTYRIPRLGRCDCGEELELDRFTNTCEGCGTDYNSAGQRLAPRSQWGEETGEPWYECY